jgi:adenosine deaminase
MRADGIVYVEFRNSPFNIAALNNISLQETIDWLAEAAASAEDRYKLKVRLIISLSRYRFDLDMAYLLLNSIKLADGRKYIVGVDLSGDEDTQVPDEACRFFRVAKEELGLSITIHAGETGNNRNIEWAIIDCGADRIGHGLAAVNCPKTVELIIDRDVCVELCLCSNFRTGRVQNPANHPIVKFIELGIPFVLCSDNPAVHGTTLSDDYYLFSKITGRADILEQMFERQKRYAFLGN